MMWKTAPKKECVTTKALCKSLLQGCKICFPQTQQAPSRHHFELSESANNSRLVLPRLAENLEGWPGRGELPWNISGIKLQCEQQGGALWPPLALHSHRWASLATFRATRAFLRARAVPAASTLTTSCPWPRDVTKQKLQWPQKKKTQQQPKLHLKPRTWLKFTKEAPLFTNPLHLKISRGKGHQYVQCTSQSKGLCHAAVRFSLQTGCYKNPACCVIRSRGGQRKAASWIPTTCTVPPACSPIPTPGSLKGAGSGTQSLFFPYDE